MNSSYSRVDEAQSAIPSSLIVWLIANSQSLLPLWKEHSTTAHSISLHWHQSTKILFILFNKEVCLTLSQSFRFVVHWLFRIERWAEQTHTSFLCVKNDHFVRAMQRTPHIVFLHHIFSWKTKITTSMTLAVISIWCWTLLFNTIRQVHFHHFIESEWVIVCVCVPSDFSLWFFHL